MDLENQSETRIGKRITSWLEGFPADSPVVVVPVYNAYEDVLECVDSLLASTRPRTPILILDDASTDDRIPDTLEPLSHSRGFAYARRPSNGGFVSTSNLAFTWCAPRDVVLVNSDVIVPAGWLERLQEAAYFRSTIATATPLTNHGSILSVPYRNRPVQHLVEGMTVAQIDARIRDASLRLRPIIPTAIGHCIYFKRQALDTVGYFDDVFSPGYGEEADFSQRAVAAGFSHVVADDLFVFHKGSRSFDQEGREERQRVQNAHEGIVNKRYPWYRWWVAETASNPRNPLARVLERSRSALLGYRIAIDATLIRGATTGTQVLTRELIQALADCPNRCEHLALIIQDGTEEEELLGLDQVVDEVVYISDLYGLEQPRFDLIHRPFQVRSTRDLDLLQRAASRFIVSQLDCIFFANPSYADSLDEWQQYRDLTRSAVACADGVAFISSDAAQDAVHQGLDVPSDRVCVTYVGVDHLLHSVGSTPPAGSDLFRDQPFILMLGTNFRHKNRVYTLKLFRALAEKHDWPGHLVFAGPDVSHGGSVAEETLERSGHPELQSRVHYLGAVSEAEKRWLLENATLLLFPSIYEGFGLVPFEAAALGTPSLTTRSTSLSEVLGDRAIYLETLDAETGAQVTWSLLSQPDLVREQLAAIQAMAGTFEWRDVAEKTWDFYRNILEMPPRLLGYKVQVEESETAPKTWRERIAMAAYVLLMEGPSSLWREIQQYIRWRFA